MLVWTTLGWPTLGWSSRRCSPGLLRCTMPGASPGQGPARATTCGWPSLRGGEDGLRLAAHLAELAWLAAPDDQEIAQARHRVFTIRADRATSTMSTGVYRWAATESLGDPFGQSAGER